MNGSSHKNNGILKNGKNKSKMQCKQDFIGKSTEMPRK